MGSVFRQKTTRKDGRVVVRRNWMMKYYVDGKPIIESSETASEAAAIALCTAREAESRLTFRAQRRARAIAAVRSRRWQAQPVPFTRSLDGWCWVYVIQAGDVVKIGRALDVADRVRTLQSANPEPLRLLAAVPAHAALESAIHARFAHLRRDGEWFDLDPDLLRFIDAIRTGCNPVSLLFEP